MGLEYLNRGQVLFFPHTKVEYVIKSHRGGRDIFTTGGLGGSIDPRDIKTSFSFRKLEKS